MFGTLELYEVTTVVRVGGDEEPWEKRMVRKEKQASGECPGLRKRNFQWIYYVLEKYICNGNYRYLVNILQMNSKKNPVEKCKNDMNRQFTEGQILTANKPMKRCLISPLIREMQI